MYQIDNSTAATTQPAATSAGTAGFFTDGNPATSTPATIVPAEWLNAVMMELSNVVTAAGLTLSKPTYNQVLAAIKRLGQSTIILADTGAANAYTAVNSPPLVAGTWVDGVVQQVKIAHANTGASTYAPDGLTAIPIYGLGLQPLQGGELALNGTAVLMRATIPGANSGNPIAVLMECAGGAQQVAPATQSQHAVQMGQAAGVVGSTRNLVMSVTAASATATLTADEIIVETALGGVRYCLPSFSKTINLATTGAGGMDTGTAPVSGFVAIYAIYNPTTQTAALLATNATSSVAPNIYAGGSMPAGYTASALVSVWPTNASSQFAVASQYDRAINFASTGVYSGSGVVSLQTINLGGVVPKNAKYAAGVLSITVSSSGVSSYNIFDQTATGSSTVMISVNTGGSAAGGNSNNFPRFPILTAQTWYISSTQSATISNMTVSITQYEF
jgi:hypothetical protein